MKEKINITLRYTGQDVDDGTMSIEDIVPALQGFASAYGKIATLKNIDTQHKLRITGIEKGSFHVLLEAWDLAKANSDQIALAVNLTVVAGMIGSSGFFIVKSIMGLIKMKKHIKNEPYTEKIGLNQNIIVKNSENVTLEIPVFVFNLFKDKTLDQDLNKIVRPLEKGKIDEAVLEAKQGKNSVEEIISVDDKPFFEVETITITSTKSMWLVGTFNSLTKTTNKGHFILTDGTRVSYQFISEHPENMYQFFVYRGPVKVKCVAQMDENLKVSMIDIYEVEKLQTEMFE